MTGRVPSCCHASTEVAPYSFGFRPSSHRLRSSATASGGAGRGPRRWGWSRSNRGRTGPSLHVRASRRRGRRGCRTALRCARGGPSDASVGTAQLPNASFSPGGGESKARLSSSDQFSRSPPVHRRHRSEDVHPACVLRSFRRGLSPSGTHSGPLRVASPGTPIPAGRIPGAVTQGFTGPWTQSAGSGCGAPLPRHPPRAGRSRPRWCECRCGPRIREPRASKRRFGWRR